MSIFPNNSLTGFLNDKISSNASEDVNALVGNTELYGSIASITGSIDAGLDAFGIRSKVKHKCVICGKSFEYLPFDGFCSFECFSKWAMQTLLCTFDSTDSFLTTIFNMIRNLSSLISGTLNLIGSIPTIIHQVDVYPSMYQDYLKQKVSWLFTFIDIIIDELMIKKNQYIIKFILDPIIKDRFIFKKLGQSLEWINSAVSIVQQMQLQLQTAYRSAKAAIQAQADSLLPPEGYAFYKTARTSKKVPTQKMWQIPTNTNITLSVLSDKNIQSISKFLKISFPPIEEAEYLLDETMFSARLLASSLNAKNISENIIKLNRLLKLGGQYLPPYEELTLKNPWFDVAIYFGWGPMSQFCFGCSNPIYP